jgi:hypothetical protein
VTAQTCFVWMAKWSLVTGATTDQRVQPRLRGKRVIPAYLHIRRPRASSSQWFVDLLERLGYEVWGDAAKISASYVRLQKTDWRDAGHILKLLMENRFPRIWWPSEEERDLRQLLVHLHKLVEIRLRVSNRFVRQLLVGAAQTAVRLDEVFRRGYAARCHHKPKGVAKVAAARKGSATLMDDAHAGGMSGNRPHREQLAGAPERQPDSKDCLSALASSSELDVRMEALWPVVDGRIGEAAKRSQVR